jgi:hypothetical protein
MNHHASRWMSGFVLLLLAFGISACTLPGNDTPQEEPLTFEGAPSVNISSPVANATYLQGTDVNILARIENAGADIVRVEIMLDDTIIGQGENPNPTGAAAFTITNSWPATITGPHTISITASRADGTSDTASVIINVREASNNATNNTNTNNQDTSNQSTDDTGADNNDVDAQNADGSNADTATATDVPLPTPVPVQPSATPVPAEPTTPPEPTAVPPTATPSVPIARVIQGANVRSGPNTVFAPPIGSLAANETSEILARNPAGDWYKIRYYNDSAWIFASLVEVSGNISALPVEVGPPTPIPATATPAVTATPTPAPSNINLSIGGVSVAPHPLACGQTSTVTVTVNNTGTAGMANTARIRVQAILLSDGSVQTETFVPLGVIEAGGSLSISTPLTVTTNVGQGQDIRVTVDDLNEVIESNENDNTYQGDTFVLGSGSC